MNIEAEKGWVILRLTPEEAALLANDCDDLAQAAGEETREVELELRRASDRAERKN